jgi:hypothetical protein
MTPEGMDLWTPEARHRVYKTLRLEVYAAPNEKTEADMPIYHTVDLDEALYSVKSEDAWRSARTADR